MITTTWTSPSMECPKWLLELFEDGQKCAAGSITYISAGLARLEDVGVLPEFCGKGIGDFLVKVLVYKCAQLEIKSVLTEKTDRSAAFYKHLGFIENGTNDLIKEIDDGGCENCANKRACQEGQG